MYDEDGKDTLGTPDDDRDIDGVPSYTEETLANLGGGSNGDLNGDGLPDAEQNALATLAWIVRENFETALSESVEDTPRNSIVTLGVKTGGADAEGKYEVDTAYRLEAIEVLSGTDEAVGGGKPTNLNGQTVSAPWDPIRFAVVSNDAEPLKDLDGNPENGTQILVVIDISRANLPEGYFNAYLKYVQVADDATEFQKDLLGNDITESGWYDFTRRTDPVSGEFVGDGAVFVVRAGKIVAIELYLTDNAFGDNDPAEGRIFDPGMPVFVRALRSDVTPEPVKPRPPAPEVVPEAAKVVVPPQPPAAQLEDLNKDIDFVLDGANPDRYGPLRFDSALHPLLASASMAPSYLTEPVDGQPFQSDDWMRYFDLYAVQGDWKIAVLPAESELLSVFRGVDDQFLQAQAEGEFVLPWDAFAHSKADAQVTLEATLADGSALPAWIRFDPRTGSFSYRLPADWRGELAIKVKARDGRGNEVSTVFRIHGGERARAAAELPAGRSGLQEQLREAARQRQVAMKAAHA